MKNNKFFIVRKIVIQTETVEFVVSVCSVFYSSLNQEVQEPEKESFSIKKTHYSLFQNNFFLNKRCLTTTEDSLPERNISSYSASNAESFEVFAADFFEPSESIVFTKSIYHNISILVKQSNK